jgi:hypothetical protein
MPKVGKGKVKANLSITKEAQDIMFDHGYASARTMGEFISRLIVEHHERVKDAPKPVAPTDPPAEQEDNEPAHQLPYDLAEPTGNAGQE